MSDRRKQIKLMSGANEERKFVYCLFVVFAESITAFLLYVRGFAEMIAVFFVCT